VVCVISPVGDDGRAFAQNRGKALFCMGYISFIATGNSDPNWPANSVTNQMQLGIQTAFRSSYCTSVAGVFLHHWQQFDGF